MASWWISQRSGGTLGVEMFARQAWARRQPKSANASAQTNETHRWRHDEKARVSCCTEDRNTNQEPGPRCPWDLDICWWELNPVDIGPVLIAENRRAEVFTVSQPQSPPSHPTAPGTIESMTPSLGAHLRLDRRHPPCPRAGVASSRMDFGRGIRPGVANSQSPLRAMSSNPNSKAIVMHCNLCVVRQNRFLQLPKRGQLAQGFVSHTLFDNTAGGADFLTRLWLPRICLRSDLSGRLGRRFVQTTLLLRFRTGTQTPTAQMPQGLGFVWRRPWVALRYLSGPPQRAAETRASGVDVEARCPNRGSPGHWAARLRTNQFCCNTRGGHMASGKPGH